MKYAPACDALDVMDDPDVTLCDAQGNAIYCGFHIHSDGTGCISSALDCDSGHFVEDYATPLRVPVAQLAREFADVVMHATDWWLEDGRRAPAYKRQLAKKQKQIAAQIKRGDSDLD